MKLATIEGKTISRITLPEFRSLLMEPDKVSPNPELLRFIQLFCKHIKSISGSRISDDKPYPKRFLDIQSSLLVGDETY